MKKLLMILTVLVLLEDGTYEFKSSDAVIDVKTGEVMFYQEGKDPPLVDKISLRLKELGVPSDIPSGNKSVAS